jgi:hypothetical protein
MPTAVSAEKIAAILNTDELILAIPPSIESFSFPTDGALNPQVTVYPLESSIKTKL